VNSAIGEGLGKLYVAKYFPPESKARMQALVANLIVIVICSSYENFVSPIDYSKHPTWPPGLVNIGFSGLKQKLLGFIVAIAAVSVLEWFTDIDRKADSVKLAWVVGILLAFAVAMLVLAIADRVSSATEDRP